MAEKVHTGGLMSFNYTKGQKRELDEERKKEIREAYGKYYERKVIEKRRKIVLLVGLIFIIIILFILAIFFLKF